MDKAMKAYAPMMEEICRQIMDFGPDMVGICMTAKDGSCTTMYINKELTLPAVPVPMIAQMAFWMQNDAMWKTIQANPEALKEILEGQEDEDDEQERP